MCGDIGFHRIKLAVPLLVFWGMSILGVLPIGKAGAAPQGCMRVATYTDGGMAEPMEGMLKEMYREAGLCVEVHAMSLKRAHELMMRGYIDGQGARTGEWVHEFGEQLGTHNILLGEISLMAVWRGEEKGIADVFPFAGKRVAFNAGSKWAELALIGRGGLPFPIVGFKNMRELLAYGRVDFVLLDSGMWGMAAQYLDDDFHWASLRSTPVFHVLSNERQAEAELLAAAIARLEDVKFFEKFFPGVWPSN